MENYQGELDLPALGEYDLPSKDIEVLTSNTAKAKFRYPRHDPLESDLHDNRTEREKLENIVRISSQVLTSTELELWEEIAGQKLTNSMKFESDLRIPKVVIDSELRKHNKLQSERQDAAEKLNDFEPEVGNKKTIQVHSAATAIEPVKTIHLMPLHEGKLNDHTQEDLLFACKYKLSNYWRHLNRFPRRYIVLRLFPNLLANLIKLLWPKAGNNIH